MTDVSRSLNSRDVPGRETLPAENSVSSHVGNLRLDRGESLSDDSPFVVPVDAAKLEALAEFAAGAGHEINNPLATISGRVQMLLRDEADPERRQALLTIGGQALRIRDMIGDLMLFGRPPKPKRERLSLHEVVRETIDKLRQDASDRGCELRLERCEPVEVLADRVQLRVVISELVRNSIEAQRGSGEVVVSVGPSTLDGHPAGLLTIRDHGPGLSLTERVHLFDPFFSGRQAGRGLGFGLPKCWRIVDAHHGRIEVDADPDIGTTFRVYWPVEPQGAEP